MRAFGTVTLLFALVLGAPGAQAVPIGQEAPAFRLPGLDGTERGNFGLKGKRAQLLVFWASECEMCREEAVRLQTLYRALKGQPIEVLTVSMDPTPAGPRLFMAARRLTYPAVLDAEGVVAGEFGVTATPAVFLVDRAGLVRYRGYTLPTKAQLQRVLK
jgi:peroxiredoxin